jgi:hypothetical protein
MAQFDNISVLKKSNIYFDGKCISHTVLFPDGSRKSIGVILPSTLFFDTDAPERMEIINGACRVRLEGQNDWTSYQTGESFNVPGRSRFEIATSEPLDYVCHFQ